MHQRRPAHAIWKGVALWNLPTSSRVGSSTSTNFAEQGMPEEFVYEPQESGQEPRLVRDTEHARVYAALATKGHITDAEHQWLARDIQQREEGGHDKLAE